MDVKNPTTLDQLITMLTKLKNQVGGDLPVVLEGRDTEFVPHPISGKPTEYKLAVLIADDIEVRHGDCMTLGDCAWVRGTISANGFKRPWECGEDTELPDDDSDDNKNLDGVVGSSDTNIPPCWK